jgi:hypothetical protein
MSAASLPLPAGAATETTLATLATETKLEAVRVLLASLDGKDYATETTQATLATETKLEAVRVLLASLDGKDYATQTTLAAILVDTGQIETLLTTIDADTSFLATVDYATQTTLAAVLVDTGQIEALLTTIDADTSALVLVDYATATNQTDGSQKTQVVGVGGNIAVVNSSGQVAVQNPPNLNVPASTLATEATLLVADGRLTTIDAVLDSIKDVDGIKKITDALPVGANVIGKTVTRSGAKGTSVAADITSTPYDANTEALHVDVIDSLAQRQAAKLVVASYHAAALAATTHILFIDLSDGGGDYKHSGSSSLKIIQLAASIVKSSIGSQWRSLVGVILAINATEATMHWMDAATLFALDTSAVEQHKASVFPSAIDLAVSAGALTFFAGGFVETGVTDVNTTGTLDNVVGNATTPAVGDMVLRVTKDSGSGTAEVAYSSRYLVD